MPLIANATTEPEEHEDIEITSAMIEAGMDVISRQWTDFVEEPALFAPIIREVFLAM